MNCEQSVIWMMDDLDGLLPDAERELLAMHLASCPRCRAEWEALQRLEHLFLQPHMLAPAPGFVARVQARLDDPQRQRRTLWGGLLLFGAGMLLCALAAYGLLAGQNPLQAYGALLTGLYGLLRFVALLGYAIFSVLGLALGAILEGLDLSLTQLASYVLGLVLAFMAWQRAFVTQREAARAMNNRYQMGG